MKDRRVFRLVRSVLIGRLANTIEQQLGWTSGGCVAHAGGALVHPFERRYCAPIRDSKRNTKKLVDKKGGLA
jgi:hypothetical protein